VAISQNPKQMKIFSILVLLFVTKLSFGQFAIIKDNDGFCNIRSKAELGNTISDKLENGHLVYIMETNGNWLNIDYTKNGNDSNGYVYKDRVKLISDFTQLNKNSTQNKIQFKNESFLTITIETEKFATKKHSYFYHKENKNQLEKIDNKRFWGTDGGMPTRQYKFVEVIYKGKKLILPKVAIEDLFEPSNESTNVHLDKSDNTIYIETMNSDGAGSYLVIWKVKDGKYLERFIAYGF
jgi:hypothetical protein